MNQSWVYMCSHPDPPSQPPSLSHHVLILYHIDALLLLLLLSRFSHVRLLATPWTAAYQAPPSMGFSRQEYRSGCHCLLRYRCITYLKFFFLPFKKNLASPTEGANFYFLDETPKTRSWQYPEVTAASWAHCYGCQPSGAPLAPAHLPSLRLLLWVLYHFWASIILLRKLCTNNYKAFFCFLSWNTLTDILSTKMWVTCYEQGRIHMYKIRILFTVLKEIIIRFRVIKN